MRLNNVALLAPLRSVQFSSAAGVFPVASMHFGSTFLSRLSMMLVGIWLGLCWVLFSFFDHYIQSSVQQQQHWMASAVFPNSHNHADAPQVSPWSKLFAGNNLWCCIDQLASRNGTHMFLHVQKTKAGRYALVVQSMHSTTTKSCSTMLHVDSRHTDLLRRGRLPYQAHRPLCRCWSHSNVNDLQGTASFRNTRQHWQEGRLVYMVAAMSSRCVQ